MNDDDKRKFAELMTGIGEAYGKEITKPLLTIYFSSLKPYELNQVDSAINKHLIDPKHGTFFPKPADIVRNMNGQRRTQEDRALIAWMEVERAIGSVGAYGTLELEDKQALMAIKALGSWQQLCGTNRDKLAFKQKEFLANYRALENTPIEMLPKSLPGIAELENQRRVDNSAGDLMTKLKERGKSNIIKLDINKNNI